MSDEIDIKKPKLTKQELIDNLKILIQNTEELPDIAKFQPINHYDVLSLMYWLFAFVSSDDSLDTSKD